MSLEKYKDFTCYLIASNEYDDELQIYRADDINFNFSIPRDVQPNIITVFDICFSKDGVLNMLSMRDDEFIIDQVDYQHMHSSKNAKKMVEMQRIISLGGNSDSDSDHGYNDGIVRNSYIFSSVRAFYINWPYVCFSGL